MLGEQFMVGPEVCGAVVSLRYQVCHFIFYAFLFANIKKKRVL